MPLKILKSEAKASIGEAEDDDASDFRANGEALRDATGDFNSEILMRLIKLAYLPKVSPLTLAV
jgi:hypothetical protein